MMAADLLRRALAGATPRTLVEAFAFANLAFLGLDIAIAHAVNDFAVSAEWVPVVFSAAAPVALVVAWLLEGRAGFGHASLRLGLAVGWLSVAVGIAGMILHLRSGFFEETTLRNLVYTAPFVAPLAYAGVGLLLILARSQVVDEKEWVRWVIVLALAGFVGNFGLSLADHAQNGFFHWPEWIPVISAAFAIGILVPPVAMEVNRDSLWLCSAVMVGQIGVGLLGLGYHTLANLAGPSASWVDNFLYGAPVFAPLLFANLALLALIGLWGLARSSSPVPSPAIAPR